MKGRGAVERDGERARWKREMGRRDQWDGEKAVMPFEFRYGTWGPLRESRPPEKLEGGRSRIQQARPMLRRAVQMNPDDVERDD